MRSRRRRSWNPASAPVAAGRADGDGDEAEAEIDSDDHADLVDLGRRGLQVARGERLAQSVVGREPQVQEELHHQQPERLHDVDVRSEEHTSELQSLMRISYAVFCLKKKTPK